jgi:hypothetical protein
LPHPAGLSHVARLPIAVLLANSAWLPDSARLPCSGLLRMNGRSKGQGPHDCGACGERLQINMAGFYRHLVTPFCCRVHSLRVVVGRMEDNGRRHCEFRASSRDV